MFKIGLVSVTFRSLSVEEVIEVSRKAGVSGIEWGADVHVPPIPEHAKKVAHLTEQAGLEVVSYGSYYRLGENNETPFSSILETAYQLNASGIRVWAGKVGSEDADETYRKVVAEDAKRIADLAREKGLVIHLEYHGKTLTDTAESTVDLLESIDRENVYSYWQPAVSKSVETRLKNIATLQGRVSHVHVFHWQGTERLPFKNGLNDWKKYLKALEPSPGNPRYLMMEFVKSDDVEQFYEDVRVLRGVVGEG